MNSVNPLNPFTKYGGRYYGGYADFNGEPEPGAPVGSKTEIPSQQDMDMFGGALREGYDSYGIYNPDTKKTTGRYVSKTPSNAAMKAARRLFAKLGSSGKTAAKAKKGKTAAKKPAAKAPKAPKAPKAKGGYYYYGGGQDPEMEDEFDLEDQMPMDGGARKKKSVNEDEDVFEDGGDTITFFLRKTTRGSSVSTYLFQYSAMLRNYKEPLVIPRGTEQVTIKNKVYVTRMPLPDQMQEEMQQKIASSKAKTPEAKEKAAAKKALDKEKAAAKKELAKEKAAAKKAAAKEKAAAKKTAAKEKKVAKKTKVAKEPKEKVAKKPAAKKPAAKKPAAKKPKAPKVKGGACGSCSMFY